MISFILSGLIAFASIVLWLLIQMSDPSNTEASRSAANSVLAIGFSLASIIFVSHWLIRWLGW